MNASNAKEFLPIVQALADGKQIQWKNEHDEWVDLGKGQNLSMDNPVECYRIKPEPMDVWVHITPTGVPMSAFTTQIEPLEGWTVRKFREVL